MIGNKTYSVVICTWIDGIQAAKSMSTCEADKEPWLQLFQTHLTICSVKKPRGPDVDPGDPRLNVPNKGKLQRFIGKIDERIQKLQDLYHVMSAKERPPVTLNEIEDLGQEALGCLQAVQKLYLPGKECFEDRLCVLDPNLSNYLVQTTSSNWCIIDLEYGGWCDVAVLVAQLNVHHWNDWGYASPGSFPWSMTHRMWVRNWFAQQLQDEDLPKRAEAWEAYLAAQFCMGKLRQMFEHKLSDGSVVERPRKVPLDRCFRDFWSMTKLPPLTSRSWS